MTTLPKNRTSSFTKRVKKNNSDVAVQPAEIISKVLESFDDMVLHDAKSLLVNVNALTNPKQLNGILKQLNIDSDYKPDDEAANENNRKNYKSVMRYLGSEFASTTDENGSAVKVLVTKSGQSLTLQPVEQQGFSDQSIIHIIGSSDHMDYKLIPPDRALGYTIDTGSLGFHEIYSVDSNDEGLDPQEVTHAIDIDALDIRGSIHSINAEVAAMGSDYRINGELLDSLIENPDRETDDLLSALRDELQVAQIALQDTGVTSDSLDDVLSYLDARIMAGGLKSRMTQFLPPLPME